MTTNPPAVSPKALTIVVGRMLHKFTSHQDWITNARDFYATAGVPMTRMVAVDSKGRVCNIAGDYMRAELDQTFPVCVYDTCLPMQTRNYAAISLLSMTLPIPDQKNTPGGQFFIGNAFTE